MGNGFTLDLKGDKSYNISAEKIEELSEQIRHVDYSMCGFVKSLDSLRVACELFQRQCDRRHDKTNDKGNLTQSQVSKDEWETVLTDEELAVNLMKTLEESVSDQMRPAIESLAKLLKSLINTGKDMIDESKRSVTDDTELSLDLYLSKGKDEETENPTMTFTAGRMQGLRKQLRLEKELNEKYKKDIEHLVKRDKLTRKELDTRRESETEMKKRLEQVKEDYALLKTDYESRPDNSAEMKLNEKKTSMTQTEQENITVTSKLLVNKVIDIVEINELKDEIENLKKENEHLEESFNYLKRKAYIQVHVVISKDLSTLYSVDDVLARIKTKVQSPTSLLQVTKLDIYKDVKSLKQTDIPVLYFCTADECFKFGAAIILDKIAFGKKDRIALVAVQTKSPSTMRRNLLVQSSSFKDIGVVSNLVFSYTYKLQECEINMTNIQDLTDFVKTKGLRKSVLEVHGLLDN